MPIPNEFYDDVGRMPVPKNKKPGEWDFKGFFPRPEEKKPEEDERLAKSFRTILEKQLDKLVVEEPKKGVKLYKLSSQEEMGYFQIENKLVDIVNDTVDFLKCSEKKSADKCNNLLLCLTKQIVEDSVELALSVLQNPKVDKESKYIISPIVRVNFSDLDLIKPSEAIEVYYEVSWKKDSVFLDTLILQPNKEKQLAIYQTRNEFGEIVGAGAVMIYEGGNYDVEELLEYDFDP